MKRIILGLVTIIGAASAMYVGVTGAFFSDTETSTGNTFAAGAIDLLVDNHSYYNANECKEVTAGVWQWQGSALFPVPGTTCTTSWSLDNLTGHLFFNFNDIKPDDEGEDTISLHTNTNDAYMCMNIAITNNDDTSSTEPELAATDAQDDLGNVWDGELAQNIQMVWWADDGDNVLEAGENVISGGVKTLMNLASSTGPFKVALADSTTNVWTGVPGPVPGNQTRYVAKAWCFGTLALNPVASGQGQNPSVASGVTCDGINLGNITQTDSTNLDVSFDAIQSRNNTAFKCDTGCRFDQTIDLLIDGRFELPEVTNGAKWDIFPSVAGGWNVEWRDAGPTVFGPQNRPVIANLEFHEGVLGSAAEGDQYVELDSDWGGPSDSGTGEPASVSIYRSFATVPGANYTLKYHYAPRPNTPAADNSLEVKVDGVVSETIAPIAGGGGPIAWVEHTINFIAADSSTELRFTDLGTANSVGSFLDNVRLYQTSCGQLTAPLKVLVDSPVQ